MSDLTSKTGVARWDFRRLARVAIDSLPVPSCERMAKELDKIFSLLDHAPDVPAVIEEECSWCKGVGKIGMPGATCNFCSGEGVRRRDVLPVEPSADAQHVCIDQIYHSGWKDDCIACQRASVPPSVSTSMTRQATVHDE